MALVESENLLAREHAGYEVARRDAVWNGLKPHRFPDAIVLTGEQGAIFPGPGTSPRGAVALVLLPVPG